MLRPHNPRPARRLWRDRFPCYPAGPSILRSFAPHLPRARHMMGVGDCDRKRIGSIGPGDLDAREQAANHGRSEEHTSELQSLMRNSYAVFCLKKTKIQHKEISKRRKQTKIVEIEY